MTVPGDLAAAIAGACTLLGFILGASLVLVVARTDAARARALALADVEAERSRNRSDLDREHMEALQDRAASRADLEAARRDLVIAGDKAHAALELFRNVQGDFCRVHSESNGVIQRLTMSVQQGSFATVDALGGQVDAMRQSMEVVAGEVRRLSDTGSGQHTPPATKRKPDAHNRGPPKV